MVRAKDAEVAAVFASGLAFGRVAAFGPVIEAILRRAASRGGPRAWVDGFDAQEADWLAPMQYRWLRGRGLALLAWSLQRVLAEAGRLGALAEAAYTGDPHPRSAAGVLGAVIEPRGRRPSGPRRGWASPPRSGAGSPGGSAPPAPAERGSACKRWCMFLRWMVRRPGPGAAGVDLGLWDLPPAVVVIPVDVHVHRIARYIGLTAGPRRRGGRRWRSPPTWRGWIRRTRHGTTSPSPTSASAGPVADGGCQGSAAAAPSSASVRRRVAPTPTPEGAPMSLDLSSWSRPDRGALFVVTGASGTGKTTLVKEALRVLPDVGWSVSATTRAAREGEVDGRDYHFVSHERFAEMVDAGQMLSGPRCTATATAPSGSRWRRRCRRAAASCSGSTTRARSRCGPRCPRRSPSSCCDLDTIEARLRGRATDSEAIIARRIADAHLQIAHCHEFDYLVVNEDLGAAHDQFQAVLVAELLRRARQGSLVRSFVRSAEGRTPIAR